MTSVGLAGCGKTKLKLKILVENKFDPKFNQNIFFISENAKKYLKKAKIGVISKKLYQFRFF